MFFHKWFGNITGCITAFRSKTPYGLDTDDNVKLIADAREVETLSQSESSSTFDFANVKNNKIHQMAERQRQAKEDNVRVKNEAKEAKDLRTGVTKDRIIGDIRKINLSDDAIKAQLRAHEVELRKAQKERDALKAKYQKNPKDVPTQLSLRFMFKECKRLENCMKNDYQLREILGAKKTTLDNAHGVTEVTSSVISTTSLKNQLLKRMADQLDENREDEEGNVLEFKMINETIDEFSKIHTEPDQEEELNKEWEDFLNEDVEPMDYNMDMNYKEPEQTNAEEIDDPNQLSAEERQLFSSIPVAPETDPQAMQDLLELQVFDPTTNIQISSKKNNNNGNELIPA